MTDNTFTISVTLPASVEIESRGQVTTLDVAAAITAHGADMVAQGFLHGVTQKVADAAASALKQAFEAADGSKDATSEARKAWGTASDANSDATDSTALNLMESAARNIIENGWTSRRVNSTADPLDGYRLTIVRSIISGDKKSKAYRGYAAIDAKDQSARRDYLLALAAKNAEAIDTMAQAAMEADKLAARSTAGIKLEM